MLEKFSSNALDCLSDHFVKNCLQQMHFVLGPMWILLGCNCSWGRQLLCLLTRLPMAPLLYTLPPQCISQESFLGLEEWGANNAKCIPPPLGVGVQGPMPQPGVLRGMILRSSPHRSSEAPSRIKLKLHPGAPPSLALPPAPSLSLLPTLLLPGITSQLSCQPASPTGTAFRETQTEILIPFVCKCHHNF